MDILIKNMDMPKCCGECHFCHTENFRTQCCPTGREDIYYDSIPEWCPLKEQKSKLDSDVISRQEAIKALGEEPDIALDTEEEWAERDAWARHVRVIKSLPPVEDMGEVSDGYHTFNQLYHQRAVLFATIVNQNKDKAWKSWKHEDGQSCFGKGGEWFIVGIDTPEGSYTYHYEQKYWDMFDCEELERGKHWDGHTADDVTRLLSLPPAKPGQASEDAISRERLINYCQEKVNHYKDRIKRIEEQGDAITYFPKDQIEDFKTEVAIYESFAKEVLDAPTVEPTNKEICEHFYKGYCSRFEDGCFWQCQKEERPKGKWKYGNGNGECPFCGRERQYGWDNFCGFCGADMRGE